MRSGTINPTYLDVDSVSDDTKEAVNYLDNPIDVTESGLPATVQGVNRGNNSTTELLIQPSTTSGVIEDDSFGGGGLISITNSGVTVDGSNNMVFDGSSSLIIAAPQLSAVLNGANSWTISADFTPDTGLSGDFRTLWINDSGSTLWSLMWEPDGDYLFHESFGRLSADGTMPEGVEVNVAQEYWLDGATRTLTTYIDGIAVDSRATSYSGSLNDVENFPIGFSGTSGRYFSGLINRVKIDSIGLYQGANYTVQTTDYLTPNNMWGTSVTEQTTPEIDTKLFGRNVSNEPIEISIENLNKTLTTQNAQTGTSYTLVLTDINKLVTMSNASANALTVPLNASVAYSVGTTMAIQMINTGVTIISGDTGVTINGVSAGSSTMAQYQTITIIKIATDTWLATGGTFA